MDDSLKCATAVVLLGYFAMLITRRPLLHYKTHAPGCRPPHYQGALSDQGPIVIGHEHLAADPLRHSTSRNRARVAQ